MSRNMYEQRAANCVRLAQETNEAVLSFGLMKMAHAWLDLAETRRTDRGRDLAPRASAPRTSSRGRTSPRRTPSRRKAS